MPLTEDIVHPVAYKLRGQWIQWLSPQPKRELQRRIVKYGLKTGLDIGCGEASPLSALRAKGLVSTGLDISAEMLAKAREKRQHDYYISGDIRGMKIDIYDVIVLSHVIEHFKKDEGLKLIDYLEKMARVILFIETPNGFMHQESYNNNVYQKHLSRWVPSEFKARGYETYGICWKILGRRDRGFSIKSEWLRRFVERLMQRFVYNRPEYASFFAAILDKQKLTFRI